MTVNEISYSGTFRHLTGGDRRSEPGQLWTTDADLISPGISLSVGPGDPPTHWGMTTAPLRWPVELTSDTVVRARVRTAPARPIGTWTRWAIAMPGAKWEEHDEQSIWEEIDD